MDAWFTQFVSTVGLPGALCIYSMVYLRKSIDANTKVITLLAAKMGVKDNVE